MDNVNMFTWLAPSLTQCYTLLAHELLNNEYFKAVRIIDRWTHVSVQHLILMYSIEA